MLPPSSSPSATVAAAVATAAFVPCNPLHATPTVRVRARTTRADVTAAAAAAAAVRRATTARLPLAPALRRASSAPQPAAAAAAAALAPRQPPAPAGAGAPPLRAAVWLLADLRVKDNAALAAACADAAAAAAVPGGALVPMLALPSTSTRGPCLCAAAELRADLEALGSGLVVLPGVDDLVDACAALRIDAVYLNRAVCPEDVRLQAHVEKQLRQRNILVRAYWGNTLCTPDSSGEREPATSSISSTSLSTSSDIQDPVGAPDSLPALEAAARKFDSGAIQARSGGGTRAAEALLATMSSHAERAPPAASGAPDLAFLLKDHLDCGALSPKMVAAHIKQVLGSHQGVTFAELRWRDYLSLASHRAVGLPSSAVQPSAVPAS